MKNKGITLIALVITIIVLLILAGVTIAALSGENGILMRAQEAKQKIDLAKEKENLDFSITSAFTPESLYKEFTLDSLQENLNVHFGNDEAIATENPDGSITVKVKKSGNEYQLTKTGEEINVNKVKDEHPAELAGSGTVDEPYLIESIEDLIFFSYQVRSGNDNYEGKYVELATDLNFASSDSYVNSNCEDYSEYGYNGKIKETMDKNGFIPIGTVKRDDEKVFSGTFDGKNHNIANLKIGGNLIFGQDETGGIGFFTINYGTIKNINLIFDTSITIKNENKFVQVGLLVGLVGVRNGENIEHEGVIENCSVDGNIDIILSGFSFNVGGLVGAINGKIKNCANKANIKVKYDAEDEIRVGGICGSLDRQSFITNCYNNGNLETNLNAMCVYCGMGGIVGAWDKSNGSSLNYVYNVANISCRSEVENKNIVLGHCAASRTDTLRQNTWFSLDNLVKTENGSCKILDDVILKSISELSGQAGVTLLNTDNDENVWVEDTNNINNGYPILNWQSI